MSILLRPKLTLEQSVRITSMAAVAVARAIEQVCGIPEQIKWVNDIYLGNRKICGILAEGIPNAKTGIPDFVVVGIGINVNTTVFPDDIKNKAASIGVSCDRNRMIAAVINKLLPLYENMSDTSFMDEYRKKSIVIGKNVEFEHESSTLHGVAIGIANNGGLIVNTEDGREFTITSGIVEMNFD